MTQAQTTKKSSVPSKKKSKSSTTATTDLQKLLPQLEALVSSLRGEEDADKNKQAALSYLRESLDSGSCIMEFDICLWGKDELLFRMNGMHNLINLLSDSTLGEAMDRFNQTSHDQINTPLRTRFQDLVNALHSRELLTGDPDATLDASGNFRQDEDVGAARSPATVDASQGPLTDAPSG